MDEVAGRQAHTVGNTSANGGAVVLSGTKGGPMVDVTSGTVVISDNGFAIAICGLSLSEHCHCSSPPLSSFIAFQPTSLASIQVKPFLLMGVSLYYHDGGAAGDMGMNGGAVGVSGGVIQGFNLGPQQFFRTRNLSQLHHHGVIDLTITPGSPTGTPLVDRSRLDFDYDPSFLSNLAVLLKMSQYLYLRRWRFWVLIRLLVCGRFGAFWFGRIHCPCSRSTFLHALQSFRTSHLSLLQAPRFFLRAQNLGCHKTYVPFGHFCLVFMLLICTTGYWDAMD